MVKDHDPQNKITRELISAVDQAKYISLFCCQGEDNLAAGDGRDVVLKAGKEETVELSFGGWKDFTYWIYISVDNTHISLRIEP